MSTLAKVIPLFLACVLGGVIFYMLGGDPSHMTKKDLQKLQARNPKMQVARTEQGTYLQFEAYGKPADHKFRVQAIQPGTATFFDSDGKEIMKLFMETGDVLVTIPKQKTVDVIAFEPFEWVD